MKKRSTQKLKSKNLSILRRFMFQLRNLRDICKMINLVWKLNFLNPFIRSIHLHKFRKLIVPQGRNVEKWRLRNSFLWITKNYSIEIWFQIIRRSFWAKRLSTSRKIENYPRPSKISWIQWLAKMALRVVIQECIHLWSSLDLH